MTGNVLASASPPSEGLRSATHSPHARGAQMHAARQSDTARDERNTEAAEGDNAPEEDDLDPVTVRNTRANECMRRMPSRWHNRCSQSLERGAVKHVNFADEAHSAKVLDGHKAALSDPNSSERAKARAREILIFHGEKCK